MIKYIRIPFFRVFLRKDWGVGNNHAFFFIVTTIFGIFDMRILKKEIHYVQIYKLNLDY